MSIFTRVGLLLCVACLFGCSKLQDVPRAVEYVVEYKYLTDCGEKPTRPVLSLLTDTHLGSAQNVSLVQKNISELVYYSQQLETLLICYEKQIKEPKDEENKGKSK